MDLKKALEDPFHFPIEGCTPLYVPQCPSTELDTPISSFISTLNGFQVRAFQKTPLKAKRTRRVVYGAREVQRNLELGKLKMIIVATDLDPAFIESDTWIEIFRQACLQKIHLVYGMTRKGLSKAVTGNPRVHIGLIGVKSFDGAHETAMTIIQLAQSAASAWEDAMMLEDPVKVALTSAYFGHLNLFQKIVCSNPLAVEAFVSSTGDGLAHIAAARGHVLIIEYIKAAHPELLTTKNFALQTPLELAKLYDRENVIKIWDE